MCVCVRALRLLHFSYLLWRGQGVGGGGGVQGEGEEAEDGVAMETIVFPSLVIGAAGMSMYLLFLSLFNTSDRSTVTGRMCACVHARGHTHIYKQLQK